MAGAGGGPMTNGGDISVLRLVFCGLHFARSLADHEVTDNSHNTHEHGAERGAQHHAGVEGSKCGGEQLICLLATHLACDRHGTAEGFVGVIGESLMQTGGHDHVRTVDGGEHTTDDDGTEHRTRLVGGLRNRGCRTRLTRRNAGEHQVVRDGLSNTDTGTEHDEDQDNDHVAVRTQEGEQSPARR